MSFIVTHKTIWQLAIPMIIGNISVPLLGLIDTAVMGHLDSPHFLAAVALGSVIFTFLFWGFGFLRMATTGLTAQAHGRQEHALTQQILIQGLVLGTLISTSILLFQSPIKLLAFYVLDSDPSVLAAATSYFDIRIWSAPAVLLNYVLLGWFIGQAKTKSALYLVLCINITNMALDLIFVNHLMMTVDGVALASVIAEYTGLLTGILLLKHNKVRISRTFLQLRLQRQLINKTWLTVNFNIFLRTLCLMFSFAFFTFQGAKQGEITLAANALLLNFITFMAYVLDGFANAVEVITGKAIGLKDEWMLKQGLKLSCMWALSIASLFSMTYWFYGQHIISLLSSIPEVITQAEHYLDWLVLMPVIGVWAYVFDGLFIGATQSAAMRNTMMFATIVCYLPAWYLLQPYGNDGLWAALMIFLLARAVGQLLYLPQIIKIKIPTKSLS